MPEVRKQIQNEHALADLDKFFSEYRKAAKKDSLSLKKRADQPLWPVVQETLALIERPREPGKREHSALPLASSAYAEYRQKGMEISNRENRAGSENTVAVGLGRLLERVTRAIGFDYRINIALLGGFAAKEVIVSTPGNSLLSRIRAFRGERPPSEKLKRDPRWTPLRAFTLILFTMLYVPCFATLVVIKKESSLKWVGFSIAFNLVVAYVISFAAYQGGEALGFGV